MAEASSIGLSVAPYYLGSADDAVSMLDMVQSGLADNIRSSISQNVSASSRLIESLGKLTTAAVALLRSASSAATPVTAASLLVTPKTAEALHDLFMADGPALGENLAEANTVYDTLASVGIPDAAPIVTPVLLEIDSMNGQPPVPVFSWANQSALAAVVSLPDQRASSYPGSTEYVQTVTDANGKVTQTLKYTVFSEYANRKITAEQFTNLLSILIALSVLVQIQLAAELAQASKQSDKLENMVNDHRDAVQKESSNQNRIHSEREDDLKEALRRLRVLKSEQELLGNRLSELKNFHELDRSGSEPEDKSGRAQE